MSKKTHGLSLTPFEKGLNRFPISKLVFLAARVGSYVPDIALHLYRAGRCRGSSVAKQSDLWEALLSQNL